VKVTPRTFGLALNVFLFLFFSLGSYSALKERLDCGLTPVEISFIVQNFVFCLIILIRNPVGEISRSLNGQLIALAAFFSGLAFLGRSFENEGLWADLGRVVVILANLLAVVSLLTLKDSFAILIARRDLKCRGVYAVVRHPMYLSDILIRLGFFLVYPSIDVLILVLATALFYVVRALWEEKFLMGYDDYLAYSQKVRYRFIPWIF
jgi:protein-S-isoprenylcysteine O-methyltransferase Ste14